MPEESDEPSYEYVMGCKSVVYEHNAFAGQGYGFLSPEGTRIIEDMGLCRQAIYITSSESSSNSPNLWWFFGTDLVSSIRPRKKAGDEFKPCPFKIPQKHWDLARAHFMLTK
jgi:hypothetical protein